MSVDSLPLEWDHTGDVGGSSSHEDDEEEEEDGEEDEEERTYFSALSGRLHFLVFIAVMGFKCQKVINDASLMCDGPHKLQLVRRYQLHDDDIMMFEWMLQRTPKEF